MAQFTLPKNSKYTEGKTWPKHTLAWFDDTSHKVMLDCRPVHRAEGSRVLSQD